MVKNIFKIYHVMYPMALGKKLTLLDKVEYCMVQFLQVVPHMRMHQPDFGHL